MKPGTKEALADPTDYAEMLVNPADNRANLPEKYFGILANMSEAKRLRFERGEWATEVNGALWTVDGIDEHRVSVIPALCRVVVAVDPSGTKGDDTGDDIGIVVAGLGFDGRGYVLADRTCQLPPEGWGRRAVAAYHEFQADLIVGETNFGGAMVQFVIQTADKRAPYKEVHASRGKAVRAEPISSLYGSGLVSHVGSHPDLEDQMANMTAAGYVGEGSPDRADALVWALTELMLDDGGHKFAFG
jgi:phage terminase large subunit-like protein